MAETKAEFQLAFDNFKQQFNSLKKEMNTKDNQLCEYKNHLRVIKEREVHYLHEIEILQSREKPAVNKLQGRIKQLQEEQHQLKNEIDSDMLLHDEQLGRLQNELKICSANAIATNEKILSTTTADVLSEENLLLEKEVEEFSNELHEKQIHFNLLEEQKSRLLESKNSLHLNLEEVKKSVECSKSELTEAYDLINNLQETILFKRTELKALNGEAVKSNNDENSLFAEVNDRRLKLQETLLDLGEKCNKISLEISFKQKQIFTLRFHNEELTNILKNDPLECQQDYKMMIDLYMSRLCTLDNLSVGYKKFLLEKEELLQKGLPKNIIEFLNEVNGRSRKMEEELNDAIGMEFRAQKMMSGQLKEINISLQAWKATIDQLMFKVLECEDTIQKLKLQSRYASSKIEGKNTCEDSENSKEKFVNSNNAGKFEQKQGIVKCGKENANGNHNKPTERKVMFTAETKSTSNHIVRRGGRVLQCKAVHISDLLKKK